MDKITKGTWIINSNKHIVNVKSNAPELTFFEATELAGKSGSLLARLAADAREIIPSEKVKAFARDTGITRGEIKTILDLLKGQDKVDYTTDGHGNFKDVEVYSFSTQDAVTTSSDIYDSLDPSEHEECSIYSLESTYHLPRTGNELTESLTIEGFSEEVVSTTIKLQDSLELIKVSDLTDVKLYYNEYAFAENPEKIARAVNSLDVKEKQAITDIQHVVENNPGYMLDTLAGKFPAHILKLMEGVGIIDAITVHSDIGNATFVTLPQLQGVPLGGHRLSADVFHKAKILLSCLRFGELKSFQSRGKLGSYDKMINTVKKLVRGEDVGPCTAIGQDYQLLERDGVITTTPAKYGMYYMTLRQREVGLLVLQMLQFKRVAPEMDVELQQLLSKLPTGYTIPEMHRTEILAKTTRPVSEAREKLLQSLRTGMGMR